MKPAITTAMTTLVALGTISLAATASAEIRLGASVSATGPAAFLGDPEAKTIEMLVDQVNEAGASTVRRSSFSFMTTVETPTRPAPLRHAL